MTDIKTESRRAFLFGLREDGSPTCHPMVALDTEKGLVFNAYRKSAKARNFLREPRASLVLLPDWRTPPSKAQMLTGSMEEIASPRPMAAAEGESLPVPDGVAGRAQQRMAEGKRMFFRLRTEA